jgi:hypothetical protein
VTPEGDVIEVTLITPADRIRAPFSVARLDAEGNPEYSLRIYGSGAFMEPHTVRFGTGAPGESTLEELGARMDSPTQQTAAQAYTAAMHAIVEYSSPVQTLSASISLPELIALSSDWAAVIFNELNIDLAGVTFAQFNTLFAGMTFEEFNASLDDSAMERFSEQLFSVLVGGRLLYAHAFFRITSARFGPEGIEIDAVEDTTCADVETAWEGYTWGELEGFLSTMTWAEWEVVPLMMEEDL